MKPMFPVCYCDDVGGPARGEGDGASIFFAVAWMDGWVGGWVGGWV